MSSAISIGTTGLAAASKELDVIGNNLANSNTLGFKGGTIYFQSMLNQSLTFRQFEHASWPGGGCPNHSKRFHPRYSFETTTFGMDLAIDGEGFFIVTYSTGTPLYTRAGSFSLDKNGYLVDTADFIDVEGIRLPMALNQRP